MASIDFGEHQPCEDVICPWGKHVGKTLRDVLVEDPTYLDWLSDNVTRGTAFGEAVIEMNQKYSNEIESALGD